MTRVESMTKDQIRTEIAAQIPKSLVNAKGDIVVGSADNVPTIVGVGADGTFLMADSGSAAGLKYGDPRTYVGTLETAATSRIATAAERSKLVIFTVSGAKTQQLPDDATAASFAVGDWIDFIATAATGSVTFAAVGSSVVGGTTVLQPGQIARAIKRSANTWLIATTPIPSGSSVNNRFWITIGAPGAGLGIDNDIALDKNSGNFYNKIAGLGWGLETTFLADLNTNALKKQLADAKGDLLVGTANDAVGRLAVGANGTTLRADSSAAGGMSWQSPGSRMLPPVGGLFGAEVYRAVTANSAQFDTTFRGFCKIFIPKVMTIDGLYMHVFTADATATVGLALWACDDGMTVYPATKKASVTFVPSATGIQGGTFAAVTLQPGWHLASMSASSVATLRAYAIHQVMSEIRDTGGDIPNEGRRNQFTSAAGAYNAPATTISALEGSGADNTVWVGLRRAS